jgi:predicted phosphodiesterase
MKDLILKKFKKADAKRKGDVEIVWLGDIHVPFHKIEEIEQIIEEHEGAYMCVIGGDFFDAAGISSFRKNKFVPLLEEYVICSELLDIIAQKFKWVLLIQGNHEARWERQVLSKMHLEAMGMAPGLLKRLANGDRYDPEEKEWYNIGKMENVLCPMGRDGQVNWFFQVGKTIFCHPEKHSKIYGRPVQYAEEFFYKQGFDFDSIVMGHTHKLVQIWSKTCMMIEAGCLREEASYGMNPKLSYTPQTIGYAVIYQDKDGNTDQENSKAVFMGY